MGLVVVARAVEVGGHQADGIEAVLLAQGAAELDAGDLGGGIPLIGGLQRTGEQGLLADRLLGELGIDAAAAKEQQAQAAMPPGAFDHVVLDLEVLEQEIGGLGVVGEDAADFCGGQNDYLRAMSLKPARDTFETGEIKLAAACSNESSES